MSAAQIAEVKRVTSSLLQGVESFSVSAVINQQLQNVGRRSRRRRDFEFGTSADPEPLVGGNPSGTFATAAGVTRCGGSEPRVFHAGTMTATVPPSWFGCAADVNATEGNRTAHKVFYSSSFASSPFSWVKNADEVGDAVGSLSLFQDKTPAPVVADRLR